MSLSALDRTDKIISDLLNPSEAVTFYDIVALLRPLERRDWISTPLLGRLAKLHDAPNTSDGARHILSLFLGKTLKAHERERARAHKPLTLKQSGQRLRIDTAQCIEIHLDEREGQGFRWTPLPCRHHHTKRLALLEAEDGQVHFRVNFKTVGLHRVALQEKGLLDRQSDERCFELFIWIESS
jgi:hypothetical protein